MTRRKTQAGADPQLQRDRIQPWTENPSYWQYRGRPVLLLGGSIEDNLFQVPDVEEQLDRLVSAGGNYVRCTMSSRDAGNVWPFERDPQSGLYDLERPGEEYWRRFERFLALAAEGDVIVQFELWDRFDFARGPWQQNPYNPKNNANYTAEQSGLVERIDNHPAKRDNAFFRTVPALEDNRLVLGYQQAQVDRMLSVALRWGNCLYCMDNETNESPGWGAYWAEYVKARAAEAGAAVETTEMWDAHDIGAAMHEATWKHPETYSFCDVSQNNHSPPVEHWQGMQAFRRRILDSPRPRPINSVKIYGANTGRYGTGRDGQERFWRNIFGGLAAARFHRPPSGLGLSERARAHIRSMRMLAGEVDLFACEPAGELLSNVSWNEAYCTARPGRQYAVFFPDGGDVYLDVSAADRHPLELRWLEILAGRWLPVQKVPGGVGKLRLAAPREDGYWAATVKIA